ncbi:MFS transporter [Cryobacterium sp. PH29-G1]|uniref:MFS transporter n=1 Tax=Cryobacterium sp. PH29-G1 TaxID=3046211 RepID=UPI0024BB33C4|nr:MFS transporter [Cryobacterium sp. PH29-G1]MDJ0350734.1 MFS transporter [Cryobacterium sp. PH29-G1]
MSAAKPSYWNALTHPHIARSFAPSLLGRLSLAMSGLSLVLLLERETGSFATAGAVTAVLGVANVIATPWRARLIDRYGQARVLAPLGVIHGIALLLFIVSASIPVPTLLALSVVAGAFSPPMGATMRVIWGQALAHGPHRKRGFSLDAVSEEVMFTAGPLVAAVLAAIFTPAVSLAMAAAAVIIGTVTFVSSPLSRQQRGHRMSRHTPQPEPAVVTPMRIPGFPIIALALVVPGIMLGAVEIAAPAIGANEGSIILAGVLLALFAGGSAVGGLAFGRLEITLSLRKQILVLAVAMLTLSMFVGLIPGQAVLLIGFALMGALLAPLMISGYLAADELVDRRAQTEASSWVNTAINTGAALGSGLMGVSADILPSSGALTVCVTAGAAVLVVCLPKLVKG